MIQTLEWTFGGIHRFFLVVISGENYWHLVGPSGVYFLEIDSTSVVDATVCCPDSEVAGVLGGDDSQLSTSLGITQY